MEKIERLSKDLILDAIKKIRINPDIRSGRESTTYDLIYDGIALPPILVLSEANKISGGKELTLSDFNNNTEQAFSILKELGFQIKRKSFTDELRKFLRQSEEEDLTTRHYINEYKNLNVKVSFGAGNLARIPWIAFLKENQIVSNGIYPVYLLFKEKNILILAYGISETNEPNQKWDIENPITIAEYFKDNNLGTPARYGKSYVFKVYNLETTKIDYDIDRDLNKIIDIYKSSFKITSSKAIPLNLNTKLLVKDLKTSNFAYKKTLIHRFIGSLLAKPFLILTGLSGSGKTKLAQAFTSWICENGDQRKIVPVGADWTNREPLLGYPNALEQEDYVLPESGVLQLILRAIKDPTRPYFLILDEMNLSHVERYFADFLSAIESKEEITLHSGDEGALWNGIPPSIKIPGNLFIIGTVNIDETTYMFSPKVLDRANVIEFRVSQDELAAFLENPADVDLSKIEGKGAGMAEDFVRIANSDTSTYSQKHVLSEELLKFFSELNSVGAEFGYRSAFEINRFASLAEQLAENWDFDQIMDAAIVQKLLPKLHGSRRKLEKVLFKLGDLCHPTADKSCEELFKKHEHLTSEIIEKAKYPISFEKIVRMHKGLVENGFTSFAEA
jgi:5-methylcytosine-specific restriction protein B